MHIIFGEEKAQALKEKYTILELDAFTFVPSGLESTAYAIVEVIPIQDLPNLQFQQDLHQNLMENYRKQDWNFCEQAIENLVGCFGGELDTFYVELQSRIKNFKENDPGENWNPKIKRLDPLQS